MKKTIIILLLIISQGTETIYAQSKQDVILVNQAKDIIYNGNQQDNGRALALINKAIEFNPKNAEAFCYRGLLNNLAGYNKEALIDYNNALVLDKTLAIAYKGRGIVKDNLHDYKGAIADYDVAIKLSPDMVAYHYRGSAKMMDGQTEDACADFKKSCELGFSYGCSDYQENCK